MNNDNKSNGMKTLRGKSASGFTLIEMLTVIAIIGLLAGLVLSGMRFANASARRSRAQSELSSLISAIEKYKKVKGFYPPDNSYTNSPLYDYQNTLFYELTGCTNNPAGDRFTDLTTGLVLNENSLTAMFNLSGILNDSTDSSQVVNFYPGLKSTQYSTVKGTNLASGSYQADFTVLGVAVPGPVMLSLSAIGQPGTSRINPFHYIVSNPTNNPGSYDLWVDILYGGKTNRVSNWSRDPQPL